MQLGLQLFTPDYYESKLKELEQKYPNSGEKFIECWQTGQVELAKKYRKISNEICMLSVSILAEKRKLERINR